MAAKETAYIVSSLKYRPQTFEDVVGQEHVSRTLRNALLRKRLANGYIFTGPRGVGKTTSARILAKAINCENPNDGNPCNVCNHCVEITGGRSIDVQEVDGASTRGIDAIRELREVVKYPPANSNYRVYIIDEVHMLTKEAFNALLKTLEEPPPQVLFIFATTEPQKVPLTILSRCQRYDFRMISTETMVARLRMISDNEGIKISDDGLALIARKAAGSLRDSLSLLDQVGAFTEDEASLELVRRVLGVLDVTIYFDIMHHIASQSADNLIIHVNTLISRGISISEFLAGLHEHIRNLLVIKVAGRTDFLDVSDVDAKALIEHAGFFEERDLLRMQSIVTETVKDQRFVSNQLVSVELMLLKLARMTRALDLDAILSGKQPDLTPKVAPKPVVVPPLEHPEPVQSKPKQAAEVKPEPKKEPVTKAPVAAVPIEAELVEEPVTKAPVAAAPVEAELVEEPVAKAPVEAEPVEVGSAEAPAPVLDNPKTDIDAPRQQDVDESVVVEPAPDMTAEQLPQSTEQTDSELSLAAIEASWDDFIQKLGKVGRSTGAFMTEGTPAEYKDGVLSIFFAPEQKYHVETLNKNLAAIQDVATETFGNKMSIKLLEQNGHKPKQKKADEILAHPTSQHLLDIFQGEIIDD